MNLELRQWNTVAVMTTIITVLYAGSAAAALYRGVITFDAFSTAVLPLATAWGGYLARMLGETKA
jgi:hypothetical protein